MTVSCFVAIGEMLTHGQAVGRAVPALDGLVAGRLAHHVDLVAQVQHGDLGARDRQGRALDHRAGEGGRRAVGHAARHRPRGAGGRIERTRVAVTRVVVLAWGAEELVIAHPAGLAEVVAVEAPVPAVPAFHRDVPPQPNAAAVRHDRDGGDLG